MNEAILKLQDQFEKWKPTSTMSTVPIEPIVRELKSRIQVGNDTSLANLIMNESKNLSDLALYVLSRVKETLENKNGWIDDNVVYGYAVEYYSLSKEAFNDAVKSKSTNKTQSPSDIPARKITTKEPLNSDSQEALKPVKKKPSKQAKTLNNQLSFFELEGI